MTPHRLMPALVLSLLLPVGCDSPEDIGFEAGAKYMSIYVAVGADTMSMKCPERLTLAKEFFDKGKANRDELKPRVEGARDNASFDKGLKRITGDTRTNVYAAFAKACPEEASQFAELVTNAETELGISGKLPELSTEPPAK